MVTMENVLLYSNLMNFSTIWLQDISQDISQNNIAAKFINNI